MDSKITPNLSAWLTRNGLGRLAWYADNAPNDAANVVAARVDLSLGVSLRAVATLTREPTERADVGFVLRLANPAEASDFRTLRSRRLADVCEALTTIFGASCSGPSKVPSTDVLEACQTLARGIDLGRTHDADHHAAAMFIGSFRPPAHKPAQPTTIPTYAEMVNAALGQITRGALDFCAVIGCRDHEPAAGPPFMVLTLTPEQEARLVKLAPVDAARATAAIEAARDAARAALTKHLNIALAIKAPLPDYGDKPAAEVDDGPDLPWSPEYWDRRFIPSLTTAEPKMVSDDSRRKLAMHALNSENLAWGGYQVAHDAIIGFLDGGDELVCVSLSTGLGEFEHHHPFETRVFVNGVKAADDTGALREGRYIESSSLVAEDDPDEVIARRASTMPRAQANHAEVLRYWRDRMSYDKAAADNFFANNPGHVEHFNVRDLKTAADYPTRDSAKRSTLTTDPSAT